MISLDTLLDIGGRYKYAMMFGVLFCCGLGLPLPEEVILIASGVAVEWADANFLWASAACVLGILAGDAVIFGLGRYKGRWLLSSKPMRWLMTEKRQAKIHHLFAKHGRKAVFFARFLAGVRIGVYAYAGQHGMSWGRFLFLDLLGALISGPTSIWVGYYAAGKTATKAEAAAFARKLFHEGSHWVYIAFGVVILLILAHMLWTRRRAARGPAPPAAPPQGTAPGDAVVRDTVARDTVSRDKALQDTATPPPGQSEDPPEGEASLTTSGNVLGTTDRAPPQGGGPRSSPRSS